MFLHNERQLFEDIINATNQKLGIETAIIEKDYYVTMILKLLSQKSDLIVFKGGTSLSKCFHVIDRFSEDIDITFTEHIGEARRKKLKYDIMGSISNTLGLPIENWATIESDKQLNQYLFHYEPITGMYLDAMSSVVKVETALASYAFPVEKAEVTSYLYDFLLSENEWDLIQEFELQPFQMNVQSMERTYIDKVFALCDYYLQGKSKRYSRHLYDLYKMQPKISLDSSFKNLVIEVRKHRILMGEKLCPSAQQDINIPAIIKTICDSNYYEEDYKTITEYFVHDKISYQATIDNFIMISTSGYFDFEK